MSTKILTAPDGSLLRADHVVLVSPLFQSTDLGTDAFAVYTTGSDEPFQFASPEIEDTGSKFAARRKRATAKAREDFIAAWEHALVDAPFFLPN